jgi:hypothetical protein
MEAGGIVLGNDGLGSDLRPLPGVASTSLRLAYLSESLVLELSSIPQDHRGGSATVTEGHSRRDRPSIL